MSLEPTILSQNVARIWADLPAAGAWDASPLEFNSMGARWASVLLVYQESKQANGGAVDVRIEVSPFSSDRSDGAATNWYMLPVEDLGAVAAGTDSDSDVQRLSHITYGATSADAESLLLTSMEIARGIERMRITCRESGDTDAPGKAEVVVMLSDTIRTENT